MPVELTASRIIERPAAEVFAFFSDPTNNPLWQEGMESCRWTSDPPVGVGSTYEQRARFLGREVISTFVVNDYRPPSVIAISTVESTFPIEVIRRVEPLTDAKCRVSADISGGPESGFMKIIEPLIALSAQKSVNRDYDRLVQLLESSASTESTENSPSE